MYSPRFLGAVLNEVMYRSEESLTRTWGPRRSGTWKGRWSLVNLQTVIVRARVLQLFIFFNLRIWLWSNSVDLGYRQRKPSVYAYS